MSYKIYEFRTTNDTLRNVTFLIPHCPPSVDVVVVVHHQCMLLINPIAITPLPLKQQKLTFAL